MLVLGFVGKKCSGKDEAASYLGSEHGFTYLDYTKDVITPILEKQGKEITRDNIVELVGKLRKEKGVEVLTVMIAEKISGSTAISGIRYPEEVAYLRKKFGSQFKLISVMADDKIRWIRCVDRGTKGEGKNSFDEFMKREGLPTEKVIPESMKMSDLTISNNGDKKAFYRQLDSLLKGLKL